MLPEKKKGILHSKTTRIWEGEGGEKRGKGKRKEGGRKEVVPPPPFTSIFGALPEKKEGGKNPSPSFGHEDQKGKMWGPFHCPSRQRSEEKGRQKGGGKGGRERTLKFPYPCHPLQVRKMLEKEKGGGGLGGGKGKKGETVRPFPPFLPVEEKEKGGKGRGEKNGEEKEKQLLLKLDLFFSHHTAPCPQGRRGGRVNIQRGGKRERSGRGVTPKAMLLRGEGGKKRTVKKKKKRKGRLPIEVGGIYFSRGPGRGGKGKKQLSEKKKKGEKMLPQQQHNLNELGKKKERRKKEGGGRSSGKRGKAPSFNFPSTLFTLMPERKRERKERKRWEEGSEKKKREKKRREEKKGHALPNLTYFYIAYTPRLKRRRGGRGAVDGNRKKKKGGQSAAVFLCAPRARLSGKEGGK